MKIDFVPSSRVDELARLRMAILTKEMAQYTTATKETSPIRIGIYDSSDRIAGYVAINRPEDGHKTPHIDDSWKDACEIRGLMVSRNHRGQGLGSLLMYAALRFAQVSGYTLMIGSARDTLVTWYQTFGFIPYPDESYTIGQQTYIPGYLRVQDIRPIIGQCPVSWCLPFPPATPNACVHGNGSTEVNDTDIIRADVLDAPFLPSPDVRRIVHDAMDMQYIRTTPPDPIHLKNALAEARGVRVDHILVGPGSSALMYTVFPQWFSRGSKILLVTPTYAEYPHLLNSIGCQVDEVPETRDVVDIIASRGSEYDGIVMVNPNSPSGSYIDDLERGLKHVDITTRVWIDETYIEYVGQHTSLEKYASRSPNVVVCKSMSKCYALSGVRVAYLVGSGVQLEGILHPPWWVSRVAQTLAIAALTPQSRVYYAEQIIETKKIVDYMIHMLRKCGLETIGSPVASYITCMVHGNDANSLVDALKAQGIYIRVARGYPNSVRIASQPWRKTRRLLAAIHEYMNP